jgi:hypothetical protein
MGKTMQTMQKIEYGVEKLSVLRPTFQKVQFLITAKFKPGSLLENTEGKIKLVFRGVESPYNLQCQKIT